MTACPKCAAVSVRRRRSNRFLRIAVDEAESTARLLGVTSRLVRQARDGEMSPTLVAALLRYFYAEPYAIYDLVEITHRRSDNDATRNDLDPTPMHRMLAPA